MKLTRRGLLSRGGKLSGLAALGVLFGQKLEEFRTKPEMAVPPPEPKVVAIPVVYASCCASYPDYDALLKIKVYSRLRYPTIEDLFPEEMATEQQAPGRGIPGDKEIA